MHLKAVVSVIICTHNPRPDYLRRTLDGLRQQTLPKEQWEFLLIDNASKEALAETWKISWHPRSSHVREDELGLTAARLRGIREATGELLVFADDDNVLDPSYLERVVAIATQHPWLGVFGSGTLEPEFETTPPSELNPHLSLLALRSVPMTVWSSNIKDYLCIPWGAGLCVNRQVADEYLGMVAKLNLAKVLGRRGKHLFSGEDDLFSYASVASKLGFGLFPELKIKHLISSGRLNRAYFLRLIRDSAFSNSILNYLLLEERPRRVGPSRSVHLLLHGISNGLFSMRCQWARLNGEKRAAQFILKNGLKPLDMSSNTADCGTRNNP